VAVAIGTRIVTRKRETRLSQGFRHAPYASCKLDILDHNCYPLCVDRTQVGVLKEVHKVVLASLLQCLKSLRLPALIAFCRCRVVRLSDLTHDSCKWKLPDEKVCRALEFSDLTKCYGTGSKTMWLSRRRCCCSALARGRSRSRCSLRSAAVLRGATHTVGAPWHRRTARLRGPRRSE